MLVSYIKIKFLQQKNLETTNLSSDTMITNDTLYLLSSAVKRVGEKILVKVAFCAFFHSFILSHKRTITAFIVGNLPREVTPYQTLGIIRKVAAKRQKYGTQ